MVNRWDLGRDGFCVLPGAVDRMQVERLKQVCAHVFYEDHSGVLARSSRGHVYAARNLIQSIPEVRTVWRNERLLHFLRSQLGEGVGLVRALFFDKPPDRSWALWWHKDTSIAVRDNSLASPCFSRPTIKAGVPHVIAADEILRCILTLRIHLDAVTDENGPLRVTPGSHHGSDSEGVGTDGAVTIYADEGDVLAMRPLISHSSNSSQEGATSHRRVLHLEFAASRELPDGYAWHDFVPGVLG